MRAISVVFTYETLLEIIKDTVRNGPMSSSLKHSTLEALDLSEILRVTPSISSNTFRAVLSGPAFDEVPEGSDIPLRTL
ncbi:MAG: hypothetical protein GY861_05900 [bacterium]|nr:hypothetical protein [bacterium]